MVFIKKQEKKHKTEIKGLDPGISRRPRKRAELEPIATEKSVREPFSRCAKLFATLLLGALLLQPIDSVFASEEAADDAVAATESVSVATVEITVADGAIEERMTEESAPSGVAEGSEAEVVANDVASEQGSGEGSEQEVMPSETGSALPSEEVSGESTSEENEMVVEGGVDGTLSSTTISDVGAENQEGELNDNSEETATSSEESVVAESDVSDNASTTESYASSTDLVTVAQPEVTTGVNDLNRYQFGVNDCVAVEDGFFYCTKDKPLEVAKEDKFYAAQDADGDFEIFISKGGVDTQITHNLYDDNAPFYDGESDALVWHALIDDRYQIIKYDLKENKMVQLTNGATNSMEPVVSGDRTVWQSWVGNNWEIILDDGGERTQLTQNEFYDIDPHVRGDLVSWQTLEGDKWHVEVYDILTKKIEVMDAGEGASVENPRFVLMYDSKKENGDVETVGYDLKNKKIIPLGSLPVSVPKDIPEPEHSKEARAIVQSAPNLKEETVADDVGATTTPTIDPPEPTASSTAATSTDLVIPDLDMSVEGDVSTSSPLVSEEYTLDLRTPSDPLISLIPDLIIASTSPSQDVASSTVE